jgi:uncharacterized protein (DUF4415 family)
MPDNKGGRRNEAAARNGKRVGKPRQGSEPKTGICISIDPDVLARVDKAAQAAGVKRSALIEAVLAARFGSALIDLVEP